MNVFRSIKKVFTELVQKKRERERTLWVYT